MLRHITTYFTQRVLIAAALQLTAMLPTAATAQPDLQNDSTILSIVNKNRNPVIAAERLCIQRPPKLSGAVLVGVKSTAGECDLAGVVVGAEALDVNRAGAYLLNANQWHEKAPTDRAELAKLWVIEGVLGFKNVLVKPDKLFVSTGAVFHGPRGDSDDIGGAVVTAWIKSPVTTTTQVHYKRLRVVVDSNGVTGKTTELSRVTGVVTKKSPR